MHNISRVTKYTQREVEETLNHWMNNGWNLNEVFIQIVSEPYSITDISERKHMIFYDSRIDNENENKLKIKYWKKKSATESLFHCIMNSFLLLI